MTFPSIHHIHLSRFEKFQLKKTKKHILIALFLANTFLQNVREIRLTVLALFLCIPDIVIHAEKKRSQFTNWWEYQIKVRNSKGNRSFTLAQASPCDVYENRPTIKENADF